MEGEKTAAGGVGVASAVPGRIRLRAIDRGGRHSVASMAQELGTWPDVTAVHVRPRSSSLVVRFDPQHASAVADRLLGLGVDVRAGGPSPVSRGPATAIEAAAGSANRAVGRRLDGTDLRVLVPLGLGLLAARRAMRGDQRLADAPWYVLAWYASETFWRFRGGGVTAPSQLSDSRGK
ncbi:MAG TPA: hypothetical protein VGV40_05195 [Solirubrobacteraceae bacterium]|nr:hypothetical protein [Solirubrobacteraceae bacterium]